MPPVLTWSYRHIERTMGKDLMEAWFTPEQIKEWKANGMDDYEADRVCVKLGTMPYLVFPGYLEAGLDCGVYP